MKALLASVLIIAGSIPASSAIIHRDLGLLVIPNTIEGISINILTGDWSTDLLSLEEFNSAPWINFYFGGSSIANSEMLRPWASSATYDPNTDYFINIGVGATINASGLYVSGETASEFHMGGGSDQFVSGMTGYLAFAYDTGAGDAFGWLSFMPNDSGPGMSFVLAYSDTPGESLLVGAIPEPATFAALAGLAGLGFAATRRRRLS